MTRKSTRPKQPMQGSEYKELFQRLFAEFEASGFDTVVLTQLSKTFLENNRRRRWYEFLPEEFSFQEAINPEVVSPDRFSILTRYVDAHEARLWLDQLVAGPAPYFESIGPDRFRKCAGEQPARDYDIEWRLFVEYTLRRIPKGETILRELLFERVRHSWAEHRLHNEHTHHAKLLKQFEEVLHSSLSRTVSDAFYELRAYGVIAPDTPRVEITEGGELIFPEKSSDADYQFGIVKNGVLTWTAKLNQLAGALHLIEAQMRYDSISAGEICKRIEASGSIKLATGMFVTVEKALDQLHRREPEFVAAEFLPKAAGVILSLLKK